MSYIQRVLQPGETVVHEARLHPLIFLPALFLLLIALALLVASAQFADEKITIGLEAAAAMFGLLAFASWARAAIRRATTELAVTDRRVIYKSGLLARHTLEMNRNKGESVDVDPSILGRIFSFGTIIVRGTGGSLEPIPLTSYPLPSRSHITAS